MKKIIGYLMIFLVFASIFCYMWYFGSFINALLVFVVTFLLTGFIIYAVSLIVNHELNQKPNKFNARKVTCSDGVFDSIKEYKFFLQLKAQMKAANPDFKVVSIERQVRYDIEIAGQKIGFYKLDYLATYANGKKRYFDVKGCRTGSAYQLFKLKKKIVQAIYVIEIEEV